MKKLLMVFMSVLLIISCSDDDPVGVNLNKFKWDIDTLDYEGSPQTMMERIFALDKDNILIGGHNSDAYGYLYRYNGDNWQPEIKKTYYAIKPYDIYGFSNEDIWVVGDGKAYQGEWLRDEAILHYNGYKWNRIDIPEGRVILDLAPISRDNIWGCGYWGMIYHYDGNNWSIIDTVETNSNTDYYLHTIVETNGKIYITGANLYNNGTNSTNYLIKGDGNSFSIIDSVELVQGEQPNEWADRLFKDKNGNIYSHGFSDKIFRLKENDKFELAYDFKNEDDRIGNLEDYVNGQLLAISYSGKLFRCSNGKHELIKDFNSLFPENIRLRDVEYIDGEIFVVGYSLGGWPNVTYVFHGHE